MIAGKCPHCGIKLTLGDDWAGERMECPKCDKWMSIPRSVPKPRSVSDWHRSSPVTDTPSHFDFRKQVDDDDGIPIRQPSNKASTDLVMGIDRKRFIVAALAIIGMLATFMPWGHVAFLSVAGTSSDGWLTFFCFVPILLVVFNNVLHCFLPTEAKCCALFAIGAGLIAIRRLMIISTAENDFGVFIQPGLGLFAVIGAGIAIPFVVMVYNKSQR